MGCPTCDNNATSTVLHEPGRTMVASRDVAPDSANQPSQAEAGDAQSMLPNNLLLGTALMLGAMVLLPLMDGLAKGLSERYSVIQVAWARYVFHLLCMVPILLLR